MANRAAVVVCVGLCTFVCLATGCDDLPDERPGPDAELPDAQDAAQELPPADTNLSDSGAEPEVDTGADTADETEPPAATTLALNEVDCVGREWVEIVNHGAEAVTLSDWHLVSGAAAYDLPQGALRAGELLRLRRQTADEDGFTFDVDCATTTLRLVDPDGTEQDRVVLEAHPYAWTWGRLPDGSGTWQPTLPTPGEPNQAAVDAASPLYDPDQVIEVELTLDADATAALEVQPYAYVDGAFRITAPAALATPLMTVGVRLKGVWGSFRPLGQKAAFRIDFDRVVDGQRPFGLEHLVLNNMVQDPSKQHERFAYQLFRQMGVAAPRVGYAWVTVNGEAYGLYANVEAVDKVFLGKRYNSTWHLYEGEYGQDVHGRLEVDEGDPGNDDDLTDLVWAAMREDADWLGAMAGVAELDQLRSMWAVELFIGHWDGYAPTVNNYYVHSTDDGRFTMLPWGTDQTFVDHLPFDGGAGYLFARCLGIPDCRVAYGQAVRRLAVSVDWTALQGEIAHQHEVLVPWIAQDAMMEQREFVADAVQGMVEFAETRPLEALDWSRCYDVDAPDEDGDGVTCGTDCNDGDPTIFPGADDVCGDGIDQDCSGRADDALACPDCNPVPGLPRYLLCGTPRTWADGQARCAAEGGALVVLDSAVEEFGLVQAWPDFAWINPWIGLTDGPQEGTWVDASGAAATYLAWSGGEPNNYNGNEDCVESWGVGSWNDVDCAAERNVVCELSCDVGGVDADGDGESSRDTCGWDCDDDDAASHPGAVEVCGNGKDEDCSGFVDDGACPPSCITADHNGRSYLFCPPTPQAGTWPDAADRCAAEGLVLGLVEGPGEQRFWWEVSSRSGFGPILWVNATDTVSEGVWLTGEGQPVTFHPWTNGEPSDSLHLENCATTGALKGGSGWRDTWCGEEHAFVCEPACVPVDVDGDGSPTCGDDCDDADRNVAPSVAEICGDGIDQDCSGVADDGKCTTACTPATRYGRAYLFCPQTVVQPEAASDCAAAGLELVRFDGPAEQDWVWSTAPQLGVDPSPWLGMTDVAVEGTWVTTGGAAVSWTAWAPGEPSDRRALESCAFAPAWAGGWYDVWCGASATVICETACEPVDADADGASGCGEDCDDADSDSYPGATEVCGDGVDQDCNGVPDDGCP